MSDNLGQCGERALARFGQSRSTLLTMRGLIHIVAMPGMFGLGDCKRRHADQDCRRQNNLHWHTIFRSTVASAYPEQINEDMIYIMSGWMLIFDGAPVREIAAGAYLFRREEAVRSMFLDRSGAVALERPLEDGTPLTLHVAIPGTVLAEASLFATTYQCDAVAKSAATVASLPRTEFLAALRRDPDAALSLIETQAKEVQVQRARIEILRLRLRRVADRLDAWLDLNGEPKKGRWIEAADQIGVSPPAPYRELARRRT